MADVVVKIPSALRAFTGEAAELRVTAGTVSEALREIGQRHPQFVPRLMTPEGELRPFVNVFVGRTHLREMSGLATPLSNGQIVTILPAVAGG